jgi:beta-lactamase superfamily II metal-dependent hydrolase
MEVGVYCLNVGQANCLAVLDPVPGGPPGAYQAALIDVGVDGHRLAEWLRDAGVRRILLIALTHNDEDHILGLTEVVQAYRKRVEQLLFVPDRPTGDLPYWVDAQRWVGGGVIKQVGQLDTPKAARPGLGRVLLEPPQVSYRLYCTYPDVFQNYAAVQKAEKVGPRTGRGPNATSAVLGLSRPANPKRTCVLFGGDLDFPGWRCLSESGHRLTADVLIAPHHGAPRGAAGDFAHAHLARAVRPRFAVLSVGTRQRHVTARTENTARHPHRELVQELRKVNATVLCTQLTKRCVDDPEGVPERSVAPLPVLAPPSGFSPSGTACAGTVVITIPDSGRLSVQPGKQHQAAVDRLREAGHHPLCRPSV